MHFADALKPQELEDGDGSDGFDWCFFARLSKRVRKNQEPNKTYLYIVTSSFLLLLVRHLLLEAMHLLLLAYCF